MMMRREIGEKGQIVIPKDIRDCLGLDVGINVIFEVKNNAIIMKKENNEGFLKDFLNVPKLKKKLAIQDLKKTYEEQYEEIIH